MPLATYPIPYLGQLVPSSLPPHTPNPMNLPRFSPLVVAVMVIPMMAPAQPAAGTASPSATVLSPFVVDESSDVGYLARSSLAGTRLNTPLKDIAAQITVFTPELLRDLALTGPEEMYLYSTNTESYLEWSPGGDSGGSRGTAQFIDTGTRSRGLSDPGRLRGFFPTDQTQDSYNSERFSHASGPNGVLFGLGSASGMMINDLSRARLDRDTFTFGARVDNWEGTRFVVDANKVIKPGIFAIRGALLDNNNRTYRPNDNDKNRRAYATATYKPFKTTTIRVHGEWITRNTNRTHMVLPRDWVSPWWDDGRRGYDNSGISTGSPAARANQAIAAQRFTGLLIVQSAQPVLAYGNSNTGFFNPTNLALTEPINRRAAKSEDRAYEWSLLRPDIVDPDFNAYGDMYETEVGGSIKNVYLEQELTKNWFVEAAYMRESYRRRNGSWIAANTNLRIYADPNLYGPDGVRPNPDFGKLFVEGAGLGVDRKNRSEDFRITTSYSMDLTERKDWLRLLGSHRVAGSFERWEYSTLAQQHRLVTSDAASWIPGAQRNTFNSALRLMKPRFYLFEGSKSPTAPLGTPLDLQEPLTFTTPAGESVTYHMWDQNGAWTEPSGEFRRTDSRVLSLQSSILSDHILPFFGWREDRVRRKSNLSRESIYRLPFRGADGVTRAGQGPWNLKENAWFEKDFDFADEGETVNWGVVGRAIKPLQWLQVHYSESENFALGNAIWRDFYHNPIPGEYGSGRDYGLSVHLPNDRLMIRLNAYSNIQHNVRPDNIVSAARTAIFAIEDRILEVAPGTPRQGMNRESGADSNATYQVTSTLEGEGHDIELIANPRPDLGVFVSIGRQVSVSSIDDKVWRWVEQRLPVWQSFGSGWDTQTIDDNSSATVRRTYEEWVAAFRDPLQAVNGKVVDNQREWRVNGMVSKTIREGRFRGLTLGAGGRYRSAPGVGYALTKLASGAEVLDLSRQYRGASETYVDAFARYAFRIPKTSYWNRGSRVNLQINVRNLFDRSAPLISQTRTDGSGMVYRYQMPRQVILSADVEL